MGPKTLLRTNHQQQKKIQGIKWQNKLHRMVENKPSEMDFAFCVGSPEGLGPGILGVLGMYGSPSNKCL